MPQKAIRIASNINSGAFKQLDTKTGQVLMTARGEGQVLAIVFAADATAAAAEYTAGRYFLIDASTAATSLVQNMRVDASRVWFRSNTATAGFINAVIAW